MEPVLVEVGAIGASPPSGHDAGLHAQTRRPVYWFGVNVTGLVDDYAG
jgi:hypothetical protein